jgi:L-rhamnose 1-dehydrogenase
MKMERVALVTGASRGIGQAIARRLAQDGAHVIVNYPHDEDGPDQTLALITDAGGKARAVRADIGNVSEVVAMFDFVRSEKGRLDVLVNNAGICPPTGLFDIDEATWDRIHAVNLKGAFFASQQAAQMMLEQGSGGRIVSIASISAHVGGRHEVAYCPTKSGLVSLMQSLCLWLAPHGITCNSVSPGTVTTSMSEQYLTDEQSLADCLRRIPIGRLATPDEIAGAVAFLASDEARYINGAEILVDGGHLANQV